MTAPDAAAIHRAAGLLEAFGNGDTDHWQNILTTDYTTNPTGPYITFCAMTAIADRLVDSIAELTGDDPHDVLDNHTHAIAQRLLDDQA